MLDTDGFKKFVELDDRKKNLETELKEVKKDILNQEKFLIENLMVNDMEKISISGKTCYIRDYTFARLKSRDEAIDVLKASGYEDYVKENINAQSISKLVRDLIKDDGGLPQEFENIIWSDTRSNLRVINS